MASLYRKPARNGTTRKRAGAAGKTRARGRRVGVSDPSQKGYTRTPGLDKKIRKLQTSIDKWGAPSAGGLFGSQMPLPGLAGTVMQRSMKKKKSRREAAKFKAATRRKRRLSQQ